MTKTPTEEKEAGKIKEATLSAASGNHLLVIVMSCLLPDLSRSESTVKIT